ncbi:MAG: GNAT family N-acetyltransferase [Proteobacteria bacterium]|nr:GNAT family N-acetyltransferase [Pseudomonadota bacterium]
MTDPRWRIRSATAADAAAVAHHRVAMFVEMGDVTNPEDAAALERESQTALRRYFVDGSYVGWLAESREGVIVGGAGAHVKPQLPRPALGTRGIETTDVPLVVNVYTEPGSRGLGIAKALMRTLLDWSQAAGYGRVVLHASDAGRALYAALGFEPTNEMRWVPPRGVRGTDSAP